MASKPIKLSLSGQADVEGKYKNNEERVFLVLGTVKAQPHPVATATGGTVNKMGVTMLEALPLEGAEANEAIERIKQMAQGRDGMDPALPGVFDPEDSGKE